MPYYTTQSGRVLPLAEVQKRADNLKISLTEFIDRYGMKPASPNNNGTDINVVDLQAPLNLSDTSFQVNPNNLQFGDLNIPPEAIDPKNEIHDWLELEWNEKLTENMNKKVKPFVLPGEKDRTPGYEELFKLEEESFIPAFNEMYPGFKAYETQVQMTRTGVEREAWGDYVTIEHEETGDKIDLKTDITSAWYWKESWRKGKASKEYNKMKNFINSKLDLKDIDNIIKNRKPGETLINNIPAKDIFILPHTEGGVNISGDDKSKINNKWSLDEDGKYVETGLFDKYEQQPDPISGYDSWVDVDNPNYTAPKQPMIQPYAEELEETRRIWEDFANKPGNEEFKGLTEEEIRARTAERLAFQEEADLRSSIFNKWIKDNPDYGEGIISAYKLNKRDKLQKDYINTSLEVESILKPALEEIKYIGDMNKFLNQPNQTWDFGDDFKGEVIQLDNGKIIPKDTFFDYIVLASRFEENIKKAKQVQDKAWDIADQINDFDVQWDMLRRDYDLWSKAGVNISVGTLDIITGLGFMGMKASKWAPMLNPFASAIMWTGGEDIVDGMATDYYGWAQRVRNDMKRDVTIDEAFSSAEDFWEFTGQEFTKQIPIVATILATGTYAPWVIGTYAGGQKMMEMEYGNRYLGANHSELEMYVKSVGFGAAEGILGTMPTVWILGRGSQIARNQLVKNFGARGVEKFSKAPLNDFYKTYGPQSLVYAPLIESGSEAATQISQNLIDYGYNHQRDEWFNYSAENIFKNVDHAAFTGGLMGFTFGASPFVVGAVTSKFATNERIMEIQNLRAAENVINQQLKQVDGRTKKDRDRYNTLNNAKQNIIDEINKAYKRVETNMIDKIGPGEVDSYLSVLRLQEKIFFEAKGIIDGDIEMSESAKQKKLEKLSKQYDTYQVMIDTFKKSFNGFDLLPGKDPNRYENIIMKAENNLKEKDPNKDWSMEEIKKAAFDVYLEEEIDIANANAAKNPINKGGFRIFENSTEAQTEITKLIRDLQKRIKGLDKETQQKEINSLEAEIENLQNTINRVNKGANGGYWKPSGDVNQKFVVKENQILGKKIWTGVHETGHDAFEQLAKNDPTLFKDLSVQIIEYLKTHNPTLYNKMLMDGMLQRGDVENVMEFLEVLAGDPNILKNNGYLSSIIAFMTNHKTKLDPIPFKGQLDTIEWLQGIAQKLKEGTMSKQDIIDAQNALKDRIKVTKENKVPIDSKDTKFSETASNKVQKIYDTKGIEGAWDIMQLYQPMAWKLADKYKNVPGFERELLIDEILSGERGVLDLIRAYKPDSGVPLAAYINKYIAARSIEAANRILKTNFEMEITEAKGVSEVDDTPIIEEKVVKNSELRRALNISDKTVGKVKKAVAKTLGTKLPNIKSKDFKKSLQKSYRTELKTVLQNEMGTRAKFRSFLENNWETIYNAIPQSIINKRFKPFAEPVLDENGKQKREKTAQGNAIFRKKKITKEEFVNYFLGDNVAPSTKGTRKDALAEALAEELAFDATMEVVQRPDISKRMKDVRDLYNEESFDNEVAIIAKQIDRDPTTQFSEIAGLPKDMTAAEFVEQAFTLKEIIGERSVHDVIDEKGKLVNPLIENKFHPKVVKWVKLKYDEGKIQDIVDQRINQMVRESSIIPRSVKRRYGKYGRLTRKSPEHRKKQWWKDSKIIAEALGIDILNVLDFQTADFGLLGYMSRVLDPKGVNDSKKPQGEYGSRIRKFRNRLAKIKSLLPQDIDLDGVSPVNKRVQHNKRLQKAGKGSLFIEVENILKQDISDKKKWEALEKLQPRIEAANKNNVKLAIHISKTVAELYQQGKIDGISVIDFFQLQSDAVKGLKSLSRLDFIMAKSGKMFTETFLNKSGVEQKNLSYGEHMGPWLLTATDNINAIFRYKNNMDEAGKNTLKRDKAKTDLQADLVKAYKYHTQLITDQLHRRQIDEGGMTSTDNYGRIKGTQYEKQTRGIDNTSYDKRVLMIELEQSDLTQFSENTTSNNFNEISVSLDLVLKAKAHAANPNAEEKGISVIDFDDTLAITDSKVKVTTATETFELTPAEFAEQHAELTDVGAKFDFSQFNTVKKGKKGPFFNKAKALKDKFGNNDIYILTARPQAAAPAIQAFLEGVGLDIKLENIVGLENGTAEAKATWILEKAADGYNNFLFADDQLANVKAVKNVLDAVDIKSKVYQAGNKTQFSEASDTFNKIIENVKGLDAKAVYSKAVAKLKGAKIGNFTFYLPPSAEDFMGLIYNFLGKGKEGNKHLEFFIEKLIKPYTRGVAALDIARQAISEDYKALLKNYKGLKGKLNKYIPDREVFTYQQAIRVFLWNKAGMEIPGLSKRDLKFLVDLVENDATLLDFAVNLSKMSGQPEGYVKPSEIWHAETIMSDLQAITDKIGRKKYLTEFEENVDEIFSEENLNKVEALYGESLRNALEDSIYRMRNGTNRPQGMSKLSNQMQAWVNNSVGATMFINIKSATLQMLSFVNFINWTDNNPAKFILAMANIPNYINHVMKIFNSPKLKQRRSGLRINVQEAEMAEAAKKGGFNGMLAYLLRIGFTPTRAIDSLAISVGGATLLINRTETYVKQGMSRADAEAKAWEDFSEVSERTQQSADPMLISAIQAGNLGRFVFAWQNTPFQYNRLMKRAAQDLINRRISPGYKTQFTSDMSNISKIIYYGAIQNFIFTAMQNVLFAQMFDEDDLEDAEKQRAKEQKQVLNTINQMSDTILRGSGLPGAIVSTIKNIIIEYNRQEAKGFTKDHTYTLIQAINLSPTLGSKARLFYQGIQTETFERDVIAERGYAFDSPLWEVIASQIQWGTNIPTQKALLLVRNVQGALDERNAAWQRIAMAMGWPYYGVGVEIYPEHETIKSEAKEKRRLEGIEKAKITRKKNAEKRKKAEQFVFANLTFLEKAEYYKIRGKKDRNAWLKKKVDIYLKNDKNK